MTDSNDAEKLDAEMTRLKNRADKLFAWAMKSESRDKLRALADLARAIVPVSSAALTTGYFDKNPWLINFPNGTFDLETGKLREHRREDFITKLAGAPYKVGARSEIWENFLAGVFQKNTNLIAYLQRVVGYAFTGHVREETLWVFWGEGANGKSRFIEAILRAFGEYGLKAPAGFLMVKDKREHPTEVCDLFGARFVACVETADGKRLDETLVKELTGGDTVAARRLYENLWRFKPTHKLIIATNYKPHLRGADFGIRRRLRLIPFLAKFEGAARDDAMGEKLAAPEVQEAIIAWAVEGALAWKRDGLKCPDEVTAATEGYIAENDHVARWIAECGIRAAWAKSQAGPLHGSFAAWWSANIGGQNPPAPRAFGERLAAMGFRQTKEKGRAWWHGLTLDSDSEAEDEREPGAEG